MPRIAYISKKFSRDTQQIILQAIDIIEEYLAAGYQLTLRQLYYQFVARDLMENLVKEYTRLGRIISDARLAGLIDWDAIEDRTRNLATLSHWRDPSHIMAVIAKQFRVDQWARQPVRIEVWIEKEALAGVFQRVCESLDVPFFSCRGYTSQSEMWAAAMRLRSYAEDGQHPVILHFGDHDPSGLDMTRDIEDRMWTFGAATEVRRLALNMDQVEMWSPPPNPAKSTDSRFQTYMLSFGTESWELDALNPPVLAGLVEDQVMALRDEEIWEESEEEIQEGRKLLGQISSQWDEVADWLAGGNSTDVPSG